MQKEAKSVNSRKKGLIYVNEVKKILSEEWEHLVDGPFNKSAYFNGQIRTVHADLFSVFDLVSFDPNTSQYFLHQVSVLDKKASKVKAIRQAGLVGYVWCRCKIKNKVYWRLFSVSPSFEAEIPVEGLP